MGGRVFAASAVLGLVLFGGALILAYALEIPRAVVLHMALAVGAAPMIFLGIAYFVPVLTRGKGPTKRLLVPAVLVLAAGLVAVAGLWTRQPLILGVGATLGIAATLAELTWAARRARRTLGSPHSGVHWYLAALASLGLGLAAILLAILWPAHWTALRELHLTLNLLGLVALTALGTLEVLVPTAARYSDRHVGRRLRRNLALAMMGTAACAAGGVWSSPLYLAGVAIWGWVLGRFWWATLVINGRHVWGWHSPGLSLALSPLGLLLALLTGGFASDAPTLRASEALAIYFLAFLLPLVTSAVSYLLPVLIRPGRQTPMHERARRRLGWGSALQSLAYLASALAVAMGQTWGYLLALTILLAFLARVPLALMDTLPPSEVPD